MYHACGVKRKTQEMMKKRGNADHTRSMMMMMMLLMFGDQKATKYRLSVLILIGNRCVFMQRANIMLNVNNVNIYMYHSHSGISDADPIIMKGHKRR